MNRQYILYNLKEAKKQLDSLIQDIENDAEYDIGEYIVDIVHLYHHVNTAWNSKESTQEESDICSEENFEKWRDFPKDIYLGL